MANPQKAVFYVNDNVIGAPGPATQTDTFARWGVGDILGFNDFQTGASSANRGGGFFMYAQGSNVTALGQVVQIQNGSAVVFASANSASFFPLAVAAGNLSATNVYGWVQIQGLCDYLLGTNSSVAAGAPLYLASGTAGQAVSVASAGLRLEGFVPVASYTSADTYMLVNLNLPRNIGVTAQL